MSQDSFSEPWVYIGGANNALWKNTYRTKEECEASLDCWKDYVREPAAGGGRKIHDLATVNGYAKCWGFWSRTVTHDASIAPYPYGSVPSPIWPAQSRMSLTVPAETDGSTETSKRARKRPEDTISMQYIGFTTHNPATARGAPTRLFKWGLEAEDLVVPTADVLVSGVFIVVFIIVAVCGVVALIARRLMSNDTKGYFKLPKSLTDPFPRTKTAPKEAEDEDGSKTIKRQMSIMPSKAKKTKAKKSKQQFAIEEAVITVRSDGTESKGFVDAFHEDTGLYFIELEERGSGMVLGFSEDCLRKADKAPAAAPAPAAEAGQINA